MQCGTILRPCITETAGDAAVRLGMSLVHLRNLTQAVDPQCMTFL